MLLLLLRHVMLVLVEGSWRYDHVRRDGRRCWRNARCHSLLRLGLRDVRRRVLSKIWLRRGGRLLRRQRLRRRHRTRGENVLLVWLRHGRRLTGRRGHVCVGRTLLLLHEIRVLCADHLAAGVHAIVAGENSGRGILVAGSGDVISVHAIAVAVGSRFTGGRVVRTSRTGRRLASPCRGGNSNRSPITRLNLEATVVRPASRRSGRRSLQGSV